MKRIRIKMNEQPAIERIENFSEVALGYTEEQAQTEAARCLRCPTQPCVSSCPVNVPIPGFITEILNNNYDKAYQLIAGENFLPAICGRVCPQEQQCEARCVKGVNAEPVAIGSLERFIGDWSLNQQHTVKASKSKHKVAVLGSGPAGLACAAELARVGIEVSVYEALHALGGVLRYGIPEFRLPKHVLDTEIDKLKRLGVKFYTNVLIGNSLTVEDLLQEGNEAIFVGSGAGLPRFLGIPGENLNGVYSANEYLTRVNLMNAGRFPSSPTPVKSGNEVIVVGGGNVALDVARVAKRLGAANVTIVYRRSMKELPARKEEIVHAQEEMINFKLLSQPIAVTGENSEVTGMECLSMELGEPDESGRRRPVAIENSNFILKADVVIVAVGQTPNPLFIKNTPELAINKWGGIIVDQSTMSTSIDKVYAGGDAVTGAATVISAMGAGKRAAQSIVRRIM